MGRILTRLLAVLGVAGLALIGACRLMPSEWALNAPLGHVLFGWGRPPPEPSVFGSRIRVPDGFEIRLFAEVPGARWLRFTPDGDLLVSVPRKSLITRLTPDGDGDGRADSQQVLLNGLNRPHGMDFHDGWLYVGETDAVGRVRWKDGGVSGDFERVVSSLPDGGNHWTRTIRIGPDGMLYVSVGSSCNVCIEEDPRRAALLRYRSDGSGEEIFAAGLRNAVGFDWRPGTDELYATDNGRDLLGDDFPPCELNRVVRGGFYGWPFANAERVPDPDFGAGRDAEISTSIPPAHDFRPHNAPLGIHFVRQGALGPDLQHAAVVALHGSWNRSSKDGYKVVSLHWNDAGDIEERDLIWGFLEDEDVIGRPVDVTEGPDGALYVSDDYAGAIYRLTWRGAPRGAGGPTTDGAHASR